MLTSLSRRLIAVLALPLLLLFANSSALGARALRHETKRATPHRAAHHRRPGGRSSHRSSGRSAATHTAVAAAPLVATSVLLLGDEALESQRDSVSPGQAEAFPFKAAHAGLATTAHVYVDYHNSARTLIVGLYANAGGHPGALLAAGATAYPRTRAWNTASLPPVQLASGSTYWLAVLGTGGTLRYRDRANGPCQAETSAQTGLGALPAAWSTGTAYSTCPISAYLTGTSETLPVDPPEP
ncbi:MAG: hypothetical protein ACHQE6_11030, partial [Solirubrobacterales bacterium]